MCAVRSKQPPQKKKVKRSNAARSSHIIPDELSKTPIEQMYQLEFKHAL